MPAAPGAAVLAEELPPGKDTERFTAWGCSCSLPRPMEEGGPGQEGAQSVSTLLLTNLRCGAMSRRRP